MGVLDTVLRYKQQKDAEATADISAIPQAAMLYQQGRQTQLDNQIKTLTLQTTMAKNGYAIGPNGRLVKDSSLQSEDDLLDTQLKKAQVGYMNSLIPGGGQSTGNSSTTSDPTLLPKGTHPDDYITKPITRSLKGVPVTINVPELKPALPSDKRKPIDELSRLRLNLNSNLELLAENKGIEKYMSPADIRASRQGGLVSGIGSLLLKVDPSKDAEAFSVFKAETDKVFQQFRKESTGAQAALAELGWLAPDFPEPNDPPAKYKAKAMEALKRIDDGMNLILDNASSQGFRTGELRDSLFGDGAKKDSASKSKSGFRIVAVK